MVGCLMIDYPTLLSHYRSHSLTYPSFTSIIDIIKMLLPYLPVLNNKIIILGSQSKSRNELMTAQRLNYRVIPSKFQENLDKNAYINKPQLYNKDTCIGKVQELMQRFTKQNIDWDILICGDTILDFKGKIIEKPQNYQHCIEMMKELSGNTHKVHTAHAVIFNPNKYQEKYQDIWVATAQVTFGEIPLEVLQQFAKSPQPYRHSGGYQLTAMSGSFLKSINGSHSAVQGLDMYAICSRVSQGGKKLKWF